MSTVGRIGEYAEDRAKQLELLKEERDLYISAGGGGITAVIGRDPL